MNITFLIGNGFDLNLGLKTRYSDFYKYYIEHNPDDLLSREISKDYEMWADLEEGLGKILQKITKDQIDEYLNCKGNIERLMSEYLLSESKRIFIKDGKALAEEFRNSVLNFPSEFSVRDREHYKSTVAIAREPINYAFITFNYTDVLDDIIKAVQKNYKPFAVHSASNTTHKDSIYLPHHIHGWLTGDLILGIDNESQIFSEQLRTDSRLTDYIIKSRVNNALGERRVEKAKEIIDGSRYICTFGLSFGKTDTMWWSYVMEWLQRDEDNRLVLFTKERPDAYSSAQEKIRFMNEKRKFVVSRGKCNDIFNEVQEKIIVISDSEIFDLKNIEIKENL